MLEALYAAWEQPSAGHVDTPWRLIGERLMWALMVDGHAETIKLPFVVLSLRVPAALRCPT